MFDPLLIDTLGRSHDYLRISLTDACNLRCTYCMPNEKTLVTPTAKLMQAAEIEQIAEIFVNLGVKKIRLTGGEPLLRKDAKDIIERLSKLPVELTISTNAVLVNQYIDILKQAKIHSVNVSLDSLNADEFFTITKRGDFKKIMDNIYLLLSNNFKVKVNMVVMKGINTHAILDFVAWTKEFPLEVRFIEFMPFQGNEWQPEKVYSYQEMLNDIATKYNFIKLTDAPADTAKKYKVPGHAGSFAFISTITAPFCGSCNRLRLTADGKMKNCLFDSKEANLLAAFRRGEDIVPIILACLKNKKRERGGLFDKNKADSTMYNENRAMIRIGG
jgi:cyclic pyranopterin phosphate synthase